MQAHVLNINRSELRQSTPGHKAKKSSKSIEIKIVGGPKVMADRPIRVEFYRLVQMWAAVSFFGQLKVSISVTLSGLGGV